MATTPIAGLVYPALTDDPDIPADIHTLASSVDTQVVPRYATTTARNAAITSPTEGQMCYCIDTKELYIYNGSAWVGTMRRRVFGTADQTVTNSTTLVNSTWCALSVEANSRYIAEGEICVAQAGTTTGDLKIAWTAPTGWGGEWNPFGPYLFVGIAGAGSAGDVSRANEINVEDNGWTTAVPIGAATGTALFVHVRGTFTTAGTAGTLQMQFAQNVAAAATSCTIRGNNSWFGLTKVA